MKIVPYGETIFVLPDKAVERTESGIILSDFSKKRPTSGTIIAIGDKVEKECIFGGLKTFKVGQRIIYGEFSGHKQVIFWNGKNEEIFIMMPNDILALLEIE